MTGAPKRTAWLVLTIGAFVGLLAWVFPDAIDHRGQIDAAGTQMARCTAASEHYHDGRVQVLHHLARCARANTRVRGELRDEVPAAAIIVLTIAGSWQLVSRRRARV
ncbi:hypothetical protein [Kribbella solani]|uniref:Uncharacterized protein n=1 Tax=Kribbella solani TaxID=236067 RepID=A0A841DS98_9ACTN|nr:hypothetical protein [Kribbella solani]MBB5979646.1 hypothetical protein [Kribbella solani]